MKPQSSRNRSPFYGMIPIQYQVSSAASRKPPAAQAKLQFEQRLCLDDRTVFRKRVERVDQQTVRPDIRLNETQSRGRQSVWRRKAARNRRTLAVVVQFLVHVEKHFRRQLFNLIARVISDSIAALDSLVSTSFEMPVKTLISIGQWLVAAGNHLRDDQVCKMETNEMTCVADANAGRVVRLANLIVLTNVEQLGMERSFK